MEPRILHFRPPCQQPQEHRLCSLNRLAGQQILAAETRKQKARSLSQKKPLSASNRRKADYFRINRQSFRTRQNRNLEPMSAPHLAPNPGNRADAATGPGHRFHSDRAARDEPYSQAGFVSATGARAWTQRAGTGDRDKWESLTFRCRATAGVDRTAKPARTGRMMQKQSCDRAFPPCVPALPLAATERLGPERESSHIAGLV
jgi:hypothetical protein